MIKFIKKNKVILYILLALIIIGLSIFAVKTLLFSNNSESIYGSRLKGIDEVKIDSNRKIAIKSGYATNDMIGTVDVEIRGKRIDLIIKAKEGLTIEAAKKFIAENLSIFNDKEKNFYDIQFFVTNEALNYNMIGYKNKSSENIVWSEYSEVKDENPKK